jgi:hypothetical protein
MINILEAVKDTPSLLPKQMDIKVVLLFFIATHPCGLLKALPPSAQILSAALWCLDNIDGPVLGFIFLPRNIASLNLVRRYIGLR